MTYRELLVRLQAMDSELLGMDVAVQCGDEILRVDDCVPARAIVAVDDIGMDEFHPVMVGEVEMNWED